MWNEHYITIAQGLIGLLGEKGEERGAKERERERREEQRRENEERER